MCPILDHIKTLAPKEAGCHLTVVTVRFLRVPWEPPQDNFSSGYGTLGRDRTSFLQVLDEWIYHPSFQDAWPILRKQDNGGVCRQTVVLRPRAWNRDHTPFLLISLMGKHRPLSGAKLFLLYRRRRGWMLMRN